MLSSRAVIMSALIWSFLVVLMVKPVRAFDNDHELLTAADSENPGMKLSFSLYISGISAGYRTASVVYQMLPPFCIPEGTLHGDVAEVVRKFVRHGSIYGFKSRKPEAFLNLPGSMIVLSALRTRYRCEG